MNYEDSLFIKQSVHNKIKNLKSDEGSSGLLFYNLFSLKNSDIYKISIEPKNKRTTLKKRGREIRKARSCGSRTGKKFKKFKKMLWYILFLF